jgi:hypothetical protein
VVFDRRSRSLVRFTEFAQAGEALTARFEAEVTYGENPDIEVVVLGAASDKALRRTHGRYFEGPLEMATNAFARLRSAEAGHRAQLSGHAALQAL